ncbi:T9SS type A sorting domain-containing protein [Aquimarina sp. RZ0]|uniref:T9SS type A sorting domain-containing protein n=1 Tax=Aquimarina sp. RZ0 TaxID=2607730 RepID=UPI0011F20F09|nr:T9SS type A sorting domain-containing protein [Aquimarina sp. RZ0]KAA1242851.1 T9SS type A sorting domain-containing protein [Aquimarina sp. RZ0]
MRLIYLLAEITLPKTSGTGWNAGAASANRIPANRDGFIEMTIGDPNTDVMFGLSYSNTDASWNTIDFNLYMSRFRGGNIVIFQRSTQITSNSQLGSYSRGDIVRVERVGSNVNFKKNGTIIYTLPVDRSRSMIADVALYDRNAKILNAYCSVPAPNRYPIEWTDTVNVSVSGNNLTKTSGTGWNAGAASTNKIPANRDGYIEMTIGDPNTDVMFGLSYSNTNASWNTIDFNLYMSRFRGGNIVIFQRSTQITSNSQLGSYSRGDIVRVERVGNNVNFKKNGSVIYTLPADRSRSMIADVALYDRNAKVINAFCSAAPARISEDTGITEENFDKNLQIEKDQKQLSLSPNPASTYTSLSFFSTEKTTADIIIYGTNKMIIQKKIDVFPGNNLEEISLDPYAKGVYLLKIVFANGTQKTRKLIKN